MKNLHLLTGLILLFISSLTYSQCGPVATPYNQNNGQDGIMFDITAINTVEITNFDINCGGVTHDFEIYYKVGTHVGFQNNAAAWTLVGTANNVTGPTNVATPIPVTFSVIIPGCETYAFYITSIGAGSIKYTNGTGVGNILAADANIQIHEGTGKDYPFAASFAPRNPNITTYYNCIGNGCCALTNITATPGVCNPMTGTYSTTGQIDFVGAPAGGTLTVTDCNGNFQTFNPPFVSPINYTLSNQPADGLGCDVTAVFSSDPTCTISDTYTAPMCPPCNIDVFNASIGSCQANDTYMVDGDVTFSNPPAGGTLVIEVNNGTSTYDTIINPPYVSPQTWSISGIPSNGSASTVTVFFSNDPACTSTINFNAPPSCACTADIGTFNSLITGGSTNNYVLCYGDQIDINTNGDWTGALEQFAPPGPAYDPGITWMIYSCPPSVAVTPDPILGITDDPCFLGAAMDLNFTDINDMAWINAFPPGTFIDNTIYWVPVTMYSMTSGTYSYVNLTMPCYEMGSAYTVQYLPQFTNSIVEDCQAGTITVTVGGGLPAIDGSNFTASNLIAGTASFVNTTAPDGGTIIVSGLQNGDMYSFDVTDDNGCPYTISGGPFIGLEDPGYSYAQTVFCTSDAALTPVVTGIPGGVFTSAPGLSLNAATGEITPSTSTPGNYTVTYTTPDPTCFQDSIIPVTINALPPVDAGVDQTICFGDPATLNGSGAVNYVWDNSVTDGVAFNPTTTATYTVTGTDANGCQNTDQVDVIVNALDDPSFNYIGGLSYCQSAADPVPTITGTPGGTFSYVVVSGGPTLSLNTSTGDIVLATSDLGNYDITYNTAGLCPQSSTLQFAVTNVPVMTPIMPLHVCQGEALTIPTFSSDQSGTSFTWTNLTGTDIGFGLSGSGNSIPGFTATNLSGTDETVTVQVTPSAGGCDGLPITFEVSSHPIPSIAFAGSPTTGCEPLDVLLTNSSTPLGGGTCAWNFGDGSTATGCGPVSNTYSAGTYNVSLTVTTSFGCINSDTYNSYITANELPIASFSYSPQIISVEDPEVNFTNASIGAINYFWSFGDNTPESSIENPTHLFPDDEPGEYLVTLVANNGDPTCADSTTALIIVDDVIIFYVPNVFTPDGDNFNEVFKPVFTSGYDPYDFHLTIFNRWGEVIFESYDASVGWNGTYGDRGLVEEGVYVWKIEFKETMSDKRHKHHGHVSVLK